MGKNPSFRYKLNRVLYGKARRVKHTLDELQAKDPSLAARSRSNRAQDSLTGFVVPSGALNQD